jgi:hypothetical protein
MLNRAVVIICDACLRGDGGECHTPGCVFWMSRAPDILIRDRIYDAGGFVERLHDGLPHDFVEQSSDSPDCIVCGEGRQHYLHGASYEAEEVVDSGLTSCWDTLGPDTEE